MPQYNNSVVVKFGTAANGNAGAGASVTIYLEGTTTKATIFDMNGGEIDNPTYADSDGNYTFEVSVGVYDIIINEGNLSETSLMGETVAASTGTDPTVPNTWTAPQTFAAPSYNDVGSYFKDANSAAYVFLNNLDGFLQKGGSRIVDFDQVSNSNNSTSTETVPSNSGMSATITKRLTQDDWTAGGEIKFTDTVIFDSASTPIFQNGITINSGGDGAYIEADFKVATTTGISLKWQGAVSTTYSNLVADSAGNLTWNGVEVATTATVPTLGGTNSWTAPNDWTAPCTFDAPSQVNSGTNYKDANSAANIFLSNIDGFFLKSGVKILDFDQVSNSNNSTSLTTVPSNSGMMASIDKKILDQGLGTASSGTTVTSSTDFTTGNIINVGWNGLGVHQLTNFNTVGNPTGANAVLSLGGSSVAERHTIKQLTDNTDAARNMIMFFNSNGNVGNIQTAGMATSYVTSSDPRLKNFLDKPTDDEINSKFNELYSSFELFNWKNGSDKNVIWGFNAHTAIDNNCGIGMEGKGSRDADLGGDTTPAGVDQSKAVPILLAKIEQLERRLNKSNL